MQTAIAVEHDEAQYHRYLAEIQGRFSALIRSGQRLFTTDATDLWDLFLSALDPADRQHYTCNSCRHFIDRYANLVVINDEGEQLSAVWTMLNVPTELKFAIAVIIDRIALSKVTGVFLAEQHTLGRPVTYLGTKIKPAQEWHHFALTNLPRHLIAIGAYTADQQMASKLEDYKTVYEAMASYKVEHVEMAVHLLEGGLLNRSEVVLERAKWFLSLYRLDGPRVYNKLWLKIADAPDGFCHVRSGMLGTLIEDIAAGKKIEHVKANFNDKIKSENHMRPTAPASEGTITAANKIVEKLGLERSFARRSAYFSEVQTLWTPQAGTMTGKPTGFFDDLKPKSASPPATDLSGSKAEKITWAKFRDKVLPTAAAMSFNLHENARYSLGSIVTAVDPDAPPIIQWDGTGPTGQRNPFSQYTYTNQSTPRSWSLRSGEIAVKGVCLSPHTWFGGADTFKHQTTSLFFLLEGMVDTNRPGLCLFPSTLRSDLHEVRAVVEQASNSRKLLKPEEGSASGIMSLVSGDLFTEPVRVRSHDGFITSYIIDRWD